MTETLTRMVDEMQGKPFTMLVLCILCASSAWMWNTHAKADDIQEVKAEVQDNRLAIKKILELQLSESIRNLWTQKCAAESLQRRIDLQRTIDRLQHEYRQLTGTIYDLDACSQ